MILQEVTHLNVDDIIRSEKKEGRYDILWSEDAFNILKDFKPSLKEGDEYLGAKHFKDGRIVSHEQRTKGEVK